MLLGLLFFDQGVQLVNVFTGINLTTGYSSANLKQNAASRSNDFFSKDVDFANKKTNLEKEDAHSKEVNELERLLESGSGLPTLEEAAIKGLSLNELSSEKTNLFFGISALGGADKIRSWAEKGFVVTKADIISASEKTLGVSLRQKSGSSMLTNPYSLIKEERSVPKWFDKEEQEFISKQEPEVKAAFQEGKSVVFQKIEYEIDERAEKERLALMEISSVKAISSDSTQSKQDRNNRLGGTQSYTNDLIDRDVNQVDIKA